MTLNCIGWRGSCSRTLASVEYSFITITLSSLWPGVVVPVKVLLVKQTYLKIIKIQWKKKTFSKNNYTKKYKYEYTMNVIL